MCEIAAQAKAKGSSVYEELLALYEKHSLYKEKLISITKKGRTGAEEIAQMMLDLREKPLQEIAGSRVVCIEDYANSTSLNLMDNSKENINLPNSNVLIYYLEDGSKICARPSGTEPKIKFYFSVNTALENRIDFEKTEAQLDALIDNIIAEMQLA